MGSDMSDHSLLIDLALGGKVLEASDESLNPARRLIYPRQPVADDGRNAERGRWLDGWETRRQRNGGHDWVILRLGTPGRLLRAVIDARHVGPSLPEACSLEATHMPGDPGILDLVRSRGRWTEVVPRTVLPGVDVHHFAVADPVPATHVRLVIYPDGAVARLRCLGDPIPPPGLAGRAGVDLAALASGGRVIAASDHRTSSPNRMLQAGDAADHRDGWLTRRRREPGNEWAVIRLGSRGVVDRVVVDTRRYTGESPEAVTVECTDAAGASPDDLRSAAWKPLVPRSEIREEARNLFEGFPPTGPVTHLRLTLHPDGGIGRFRAYGNAEAAADEPEPA